MIRKKLSISKIVWRELLITLEGVFDMLVPFNIIVFLPFLIYIYGVFAELEISQQRKKH